MAQIINTNVPSLNAQRNLAKSQSSLATSLQRLSSGLRINSAKDDAAGLSIAQKFTSQIRGLQVAVRNANDGISVAQVAEGALDETTNALQRMRELAIQSANGTNGTTERNALQSEFKQLQAEISRISSETRFGSLTILDGSFSGTSNAMSFQVGAQAGETISVEIKSSSATGLSVQGGSGGISIGQGSDNTTTQTQISSAISAIDNALSTIAQQRGDLGAYMNRFESTISNLNNVIENVSAARSRIQDADFAAETSNLTKQSILQQSGVAVLSQANAIPQNALALLG